MAAAAALALLWLADSVVAFHGSSLCTICFSHMESQYLGLAPSSPFAPPGTRPLMTWHHTDILHRSPAAETLFASDHAHAWQPAGGRWLRYLRTASTSPVYGIGLPVSPFPERFNAQPAFRAFLARKVAAGELSALELRQVFHAAIYSAQAPPLTAETFRFRQRAEALASEFLLASPGHT
jgi:hypothetical protein